jgi:vancomycin resistance protein YoaR
MIQRIHTATFSFILVLFIVQAVIFSAVSLFISGEWRNEQQEKNVYNNKITVGGTSIGGLTFDEAQARIDSVLRKREGSSLQLTIDKKDFPINTKAIAVKYDVPGTLLEAQRVSEEVTGLWGIWKSWRGTAPSTDLPLRVTFNREKLTAIVEEIGRNVNRPAAPATAKVNGNTITIVPEAKGYIVDVEKTVAAIDEELQYQKANLHIPLYVKTDEPQITQKDLKDIKIMIAEQATEVNTSVPNRLFNAQQASRLLNGTVVMPGQTFSFNKKAGPYTEGKGYLPVPLLNDEEIQDGVAGGAVQVASTLYIAAVKSGFPVIERHNNTRPVGYLPPGYDAFVRDKDNDLRWINRTKSPVYIYSEVKGSWVRVAIFGAKPAPSISITSEAESKILPETIVRRDKELGPGEEKIIRRGKEGLRIKIFISYPAEDGTVKKELLSDNYYKPLHNIVAFGPNPEGGTNGQNQQQTNTGQSTTPDKPVPEQDAPSVEPNPTQDTSSDTTNSKYKTKENVYIF